MNREQITRTDFPPSEAGYDRPSVDAHLEAVAALTAALEAQVKALQVERDALRRRLADDPVETPQHKGPDPTATESGDRESEPSSQPEEPAREADEVSARLVATRLALEGVEREQIREKLDQTYELEDVDSLVDDVLERLA